MQEKNRLKARHQRANRNTKNGFRLALVPSRTSDTLPGFPKVQIVFQSSPVPSRTNATHEHIPLARCEAHSLRFSAPLRFRRSSLGCVLLTDGAVNDFGQGTAN